MTLKTNVYKEFAKLIAKDLIICLKWISIMAILYIIWLITYNKLLLINPTCGPIIAGGTALNGPIFGGIIMFLIYSYLKDRWIKAYNNKKMGNK